MFFARFLLCVKRSIFEELSIPDHDILLGTRGGTVPDFLERYQNGIGCIFFCQNGTETDIGFPFFVKLGPVQNGIDRFGTVTVRNRTVWNGKERPRTVTKKDITEI